MNKDQPLITPATKVAALLDVYPQLEAVLVEIAPAFKNLRNPVLRRTIAKVATLDRAAKVAGIPTRELVSKLRKEIGQPIDEIELNSTADGSSCSHGGCNSSIANEAQSCDWFCESRITEKIDADALLNAGIPPLSKVTHAAKSLPADAILAVTVAFRPIPLIEALQQQGFPTYCRAVNEESFELFIRGIPAP